MYFESDTKLSKDMILEFGNKIKSDYYQHLPDFVDRIELIDRRDLYMEHAEFFSRLAMSFSHGEYSKIEAIPDRDDIALRLFKKSLSYYPNERAFIGIGIIKQKRREYPESIHILSDAIKYFPESESIALCLGISYMNLGLYKEALKLFANFQNSREVLQYTASCYRALGDIENELSILRKLEKLSV